VPALGYAVAGGLVTFAIVAAAATA
jgi:hypothetical protein